MAGRESMTGLPDAPLEAARQRLEAMGEQVAGRAEAERVLHLGMVSAFEAGLLRTMEEARSSSYGGYIIRSRPSGPQPF